MNEVEAIKDEAILNAIPLMLLKRNRIQTSRAWEFQLQVATRITDTLNIKFSDIKNNRLVIREKKTGKVKDILLNDKALKIIDDIKRDHPTHVYLFQSYRSNNTKNKPPKPLTRQAISSDLKHISDLLDAHINTHSARKTRGYFLHQQADITRVMKMLNHSSVAHTMRYIGLTQDDLDQDSINLIL